MKRFHLSLQRLHRHCFDMCLHQHLLFYNVKCRTHSLYSVCVQQHSKYSNLGSLTFNRNVTSTSFNLSTPVHYKHFYHLNSTSSPLFIKKPNVTIINKRNYSTTVSNSKDDQVSLNSKYSHGSHGILDRYIYLKTLESLYEDVTNGIILDTAYGDSMPDANYDPSVPVVMALHDTPGSHTDVTPLLSFFAKLGCRTICPTFPGHGDTRGIMRNFDDIFSQATIERTTFIHDFLRDLDVRRVDVLIGVGASSYTAMALCTQQTEVYKSLALISPWPLTQSRLTINHKLLQLVHELWEMVYLRPVARLLIPAFKIKNAVTTDEKIAACYMVQNIDFGEAEGFAMTASIQDIPRLVAFGGKDELVSEELYEDVLFKLGLNSSDVISNHQESPYKDLLKQPRALKFPDSGYDILTQHRGILCAHILRLLQQFHPSIKI